MPEPSTAPAMKSPHLSARETLLWILVPMLLTFAGMRLFLHIVRVQHIYPGGYLLHHLFTGCLLVLPAAFLLAFGPRCRWSAQLSRAALGAGSAMILDEIVYLVATRASDDDYVSALSLRGAIVFIALGTVLLLMLYRSRTRLR
jgi:hypothetical protein